MADVIVIDTGAGISKSVLEFVAASPEVILVTTPEPTSITDSYALLKALAMDEGFDKNTRINIVTNKVTSRSESININDKLSAVVKRFLFIDLEYLGEVSQDSAITKAIMKQKPVSITYPNSASAKAFVEISENLDSGEHKVPNQKKGVIGFFS